MKNVFAWSKQRVVNLLRWLTYIWGQLIGGSQEPFRMIYVTEVPDKLKKRALYAVGDGEPWLAVMVCPCGCGDIIQLSLLPDDSPSWSLSCGPNKEPSLTPSVWRSKGCKSHFVMTDGKVIWC